MRPIARSHLAIVEQFAIAKSLRRRVDAARLIAELESIQSNGATMPRAVGWIMEVVCEREAAEAKHRALADQLAPMVADYGKALAVIWLSAKVAGIVAGAAYPPLLKLAALLKPVGRAA